MKQSYALSVDGDIESRCLKQSDPVFLLVTLAKCVLIQCLHGLDRTSINVYFSIYPFVATTNQDYFKINVIFFGCLSK